MTGKALVPIVHDGDGRWHATLLENREELDGEEAVAGVRGRGHPPRLLPVPHDARRAPELADDEPRWHALFHDQMLKTVERWMALADERLEGTGIRCFVCPGNDDQLDIDEVVAQARNVELAEGRVVDLDGFQMASTGWSNRTPWDTYREEDEPQLAERIERVVAQVTRRARADDLQLPLPALQLGPRRGAGAHRGHEAEGRGPRDEAGRLDRRPAGDRRFRAGAVPPRPHPRVQGVRRGSAARSASTLAAPTSRAICSERSSTSTARRRSSASCSRADRRRTAWRRRRG